MKHLIISGLALLMLLLDLSCKKDQGTEPSMGRRAFDPAGLEMWLDKDTLSGSDTLTIFVRCYPALPGTGGMVIDKGLKRVISPQGFWEDSTTYYFAARFDAGVPFTSQWQVQFVSNNVYTGPIGAFASAYMDSVYDTAGLHLYHIHSEEAERIYGKISGVGAGAYPIPTITYRP